MSDSGEVAAGEGRVVVAAIVLQALTSNMESHLEQGEEVVGVPIGGKSLSYRSNPCRRILASKRSVGCGQGCLEKDVAQYGDSDTCMEGKSQNCG